MSLELDSSPGAFERGAPAPTASPRRRGKVIHAPVDYANQASLSARGLRDLGIPAQCIARSPYAFQGPDLKLPSWNVTRTACIASWLMRCEVLHLYSGESMFSGRLARSDARFMRRRGRRVVMEFIGTDARLPSIASSTSPYYVAPEHYDERAIDNRLADWASLCEGHAIVADHNLDRELQRHFEAVHVVGLRVDTQKYLPAPPSSHGSRPVLVHAPSNPRIKGTAAVRRSVEHLHSEGLAFEYVEIQGMAHAEAKAQYERADLVIDQLCIGAHGAFAIEAMSLAKPVICYVRPDLLATYPSDLPVINANPDNLTAVLADWLQRPADCRELGIASRAYAEREHDIKAVASRLLAAYEQLPKQS